MKTDAVVLGCGSIGTRHIRNLVELGVTVTAFDPDETRRETAARVLGVPTAATLEAALDAASSFAVVAAPTSRHVELARAIAGRALALFVEKPLGDSWRNVPALVAEVLARDLVSLVGCNLRFHPTLRRCKELLDGGAIGLPLAARFEFGQYLPDWHPDEDYRDGYSARRDLGGGIVLDAIHEFDYASWLLGPVEEVACMAGHLSSLEIDTEDVAAVLLRFDGALADMHLDYLQRTYSRTCRLIGSEGTIRWDFGSGRLSWYAAATRRWQTEDAPEGWERNRMYVAEMEHFLACVRREEAPKVDVEAGAVILRTALAALMSSRLRRFVRPDEVASDGSG